MDVLGSLDPGETDPADIPAESGSFSLAPSARSPGTAAAPLRKAKEKPAAPQRAPPGDGRPSSPKGRAKGRGFVAGSTLENLQLFVELRGLVKRRELNGQQGKLLAAVPGSDRWLVQLFSGESLRVSMTNLQVCVPNKEAGRDDVKHSASYVQAVAEGTASLPPSLQTLRLPQGQDSRMELQEPRLYICGGFTGSDMAAGTEVFDVRRGRFEKGSVDSMARPRFQLVTCVLDRALYVMGGSDGARVLRTVERLDVTRGNSHWEPTPPMARPRLFACSAAVDGCIYVAGGCISGQTALASAERYSVKRHAWQLLPSMKQPRAFAVAAPLSKKHFMVCGGYDQVALGSTECFSPSDGEEFGEWKALPEMLHRSFLAAHAQDEFGNLYICGGSSSSSGPGDSRGDHARQHPVKDAQRFHCVLHAWQPLPPMLHERCGSAAAAMGGGRVFVCGGFGLHGVARDSVECFDPALGAWSLLSPMREARSFFASRLVEGKLYVFGGKVGNKVLRTVERYSFSTGAWEDLPEMDVPRTGHSVNQI